MSGTPRLPQGPPPHERDIARKARRRDHAEAFELCTGRITRHIADEIGQPGMRLLEEIANGDKRGPAELLEQVVDVSRDHKVEVDAVAPVATLCRRLGYEIAPLAESASGAEQIEAQAAQAGKEFGEAIGAALELHSERLKNPLTRERALREVDEAIAALQRVRLEVAVAGNHLAVVR